jgi:hypothetical protein
MKTVFQESKYNSRIVAMSTIFSGFGRKIVILIPCKDGTVGSVFKFTEKRLSHHIFAFRSSMGEWRKRASV